MAPPPKLQHMRVDHRGGDVSMAEQFLHGTDVVRRLQQMRGIDRRGGAGAASRQHSELHFAAAIAIGRARPCEAGRVGDRHDRLAAGDLAAAADVGALVGDREDIAATLQLADPALGLHLACTWHARCRTTTCRPSS